MLQNVVSPFIKKQPILQPNQMAQELDAAAAAAALLVLAPAPPAPNLLAEAAEAEAAGGGGGGGGGPADPAVAEVVPADAQGGAGAVPPGAPHMPPELPADAADPEEVTWCPDLAAAIQENHLGEVFVELGPVFSSTYGTRMITAAMITNRRVRVVGADGVTRTVTLSLVHGEARADAIQAWTHEMMPQVLSGTAKVSAYAIESALFTVVNKLVPEPTPQRTLAERGSRSRGPMGDDGDDVRDSSPYQSTRHAVTKAIATEEAKEAMNEMGAPEIKDRIEFMSSKPGKSPTQGNLADANQLKRMHSEYTILKRVVTLPNVQPGAMKGLSGNDGLLAKKGEKGKDVCAESTKSALELRARTRVFVTSSRLVTCYEKDAEETSKGLTAFQDALDECSYLASYSQVRAVGRAEASRCVSLKALTRSRHLTWCR